MQPQNSKQALQQLRGFQQNRRDPNAILSEAEGRLGLPSAQQRLTGLRSAIGNTENLLRGVDDSVTGRTQGSLVTEAQRSRLVNMEREPIGEQFREQSRALEGEQANYGQLSSRALQETQFGVADQRDRENSLRSIYDTLFGREESARAKAERDREFRENKRRFDAQMAKSNREMAALHSQNAALDAAIRSALSGGGGGGGGGGGTKKPKSSLKVVKDKAGRALGYDSPSFSAQTKEGWKQQRQREAMDRLGRSPIGKYGPLALFGGGWLWGK